MSDQVLREYNQADLEQLVDDTLAHARRQGASQAEASVVSSAGLSLDVRLGEVETLEYQRDRGFSVTVYDGHKKGSASTSDLRPEALRETVEAACAIARYTAEDAASGLADAALMAQTPLPDLDLCHPWEMTPERAIDMALACEEAGRQFDSRINNSEGASVNTTQALSIYGNTHGFVGVHENTMHALGCIMIARDEAGLQRDGWFSTARNAAQLDKLEFVGEEAARRAVKRLGARKITTRKAPVLFVPELASELIGHALGALSGRAQYRRSSFLLDAVDTSVFPEFLSLHERPHLPGAMASAAFDDEGVATREGDVVANGEVRQYLMGSYSARKLGLNTTGHAGGVRNLCVSHNDKNFKDLVQLMGTGLVVTELMGQGVNGVTGDYSRGASGFWVENGEIAYPVEEITIAGQLRDMYRNIVAVGNDVDIRGAIRSGSILIESMTIAGE